MVGPADERAGSRAIPGRGSPVGRSPSLRDRAPARDPRFRLTEGTWTRSRPSAGVSTVSRSRSSWPSRIPMMSPRNRAQARRLFPRPRRGPARWSGPPPDAPRRARLEPRSPRGAGPGALPQTRHVCGRVRSGRSRGGMRLRRSSSRRDSRHARAPGGPIARHLPTRRRRAHALSTERFASMRSRSSRLRQAHDTTRRHSITSRNWPTARTTAASAIRLRGSIVWSRIDNPRAAPPGLRPTIPRSI